MTKEEIKEASSAALVSIIDPQDSFVSTEPPWYVFKAAHQINSSRIPSDSKESPKYLPLKLPQHLSIQLEHFMSKDPCSRWNTEEDGEDIFKMILEISFLALDQNITQEQMIKDVFKVGK